MGASIFVLQWKGENYYEREMLNFLIPRFTLYQKKCCITKGIQAIIQNIHSAERCGQQLFVPKFHKRIFFSFSMAR